MKLHLIQSHYVRMHFPVSYYREPQYQSYLQKIKEEHENEILYFRMKHTLSRNIRVCIRVHDHSHENILIETAEPTQTPYEQLKIAKKPILLSSLKARSAIMTGAGFVCSRSSNISLHKPCKRP